MKIAVNGNAEIELSVPHGATRTSDSAESRPSTKFVQTNYQEDLLAELMQTYAVSDFCLIGELSFHKIIISVVKK